MNKDTKEQKAEFKTNLASNKPTDTESYFWYLIGKIQTCFELVGEGRLNFVCLEIDGNLIDGESYNRLGNIIFDELMEQYEVQFHVETVAERKFGYILLAGSNRKIEEAKEVFKIKDPEEFYNNLKILEKGIFFDDSDLIVRREKGREVAFFVEQPIGSIHLKFGWKYPIYCGYLQKAHTIYGNYGLEAYIIGINEPIKKFIGKTIAVIYRPNEKTYKLVAAPRDMDFTDEEIKKAVEFHEKGCEYKILR